MLMDLYCLSSVSQEVQYPFSKCGIKSKCGEFACNFWDYGLDVDYDQLLKSLHDNDVSTTGR